MKNYKLLKREVTNPINGKEIVIEKKYNLFKDQWQNRIWVLQPQEPAYIKLNNKMKELGLWT